MIAELKAASVKTSPFSGIRPLRALHGGFIWPQHSSGSTTTFGIDEIGYIAYDAHAADLLFEIVNHRYERNSILVTTNKAFKDWNTVFPNATSIAALLDRLTHHADIAVIEGTSYRVRESELEATARQKQKEGKPHAH